MKLKKNYETLRFEMPWFDFKYGNEIEKPKGRQKFSDIDPFGEELWLD